MIIASGFGEQDLLDAVDVAVRIVEAAGALAADILRTAVLPNFTELAQLAAIAAIRTALNFFLGMEIKEERQLVQADHAAAVQRADGRLDPAEKPVRGVRADRDAGPVPGTDSACGRPKPDEHA